MKNRYKQKLIFVIAILCLSLVSCKSKTEPINKVHNILMSLENKDTMNKILHENTVNEISVKIGTEHDIPDLKDCSIIVASYKNNGKEIGKVGLLGPKRMDYSNSMAVLDVLLKDLNGGEGRE